jgi:predicted membrane protein
MSALDKQVGGSTRQHWIASLIEILSSTAIGFFISLTVWYAIQASGVFEIHTTPTEGWSITAIFTFFSIARGFALRRFYEWQHTRIHEWIK